MILVHPLISYERCVLVLLVLLQVVESLRPFSSQARVSVAGAHTPFPTAWCFQPCGEPFSMAGRPPRRSSSSS